MKKTIALTIFALYAGLALMAQVVAETRSVGSFDGVVATGNVDIVYSFGRVHSIKIEARKGVSSQIDIKVSKNVLIIKPKTGYKPKGDINVYITAPMLKEVDISGLCEFIANYLDKSENLKIKASGSSDVKLGIVKAQALSIDVYGASDVDIKTADVDALNIVASGSSDLDIDVRAKAVNANLSGSSDVKLIGRSDSIVLTCSGSSEVDLSGFTFKTIVKNIKGSAEIKQ